MMSKATDRRKRILNEPSYWVEGVNSELYNAMIHYMEYHQLNKTQLAHYLEISKGRLSQLLNDGEINFSLEKLFAIALKLGKYPKVELLDKQKYLQEKKDNQNSGTQQTIQIYGWYHYTAKSATHIKATQHFFGRSRNEYQKNIELN